MSWQEHLGEGQRKFVEDILAQIPEKFGARQAFDNILSQLADSLPKEVSYQVRKLKALEDAGVDNWEWYDDAMEELNANDDEDDDED